jgi:hypothetical protein
MHPPITTKLEHPRHIDAYDKKLLAAILKYADRHAKAVKVVQATAKDKSGLNTTPRRISITITANDLLETMGTRRTPDACSHIKDSLKRLFNVTLLSECGPTKRYTKLITNFIVKDIDIYCLTLHDELAKIILE